MPAYKTAVSVEVDRAHRVRVGRQGLQTFTYTTADNNDDKAKIFNETWLVFYYKRAAFPNVRIRMIFRDPVP